MAGDASDSSAPVQITEDEAALYDRQIRLWGLEAQERMRNATIMVVKLRGVATETIKNIVLAGIGKLVVVDDGIVSPEDLGAGFFFRDEDVGQKRVDAAKAKIESLNPLVTVETRSNLNLRDSSALDEMILGVDLVCITDVDRDSMVLMNDSCRRVGKPLYAGGSYSYFGYIFVDLIEHEYYSDRASAGGARKRVKTIVSYCPLKTALQPYKWSGMNRMQTKNLNPAAVFTILGLWEFQSRHSSLPNDDQQTAEVELIAGEMFRNADVNKVIKSIPVEMIQGITATAVHEFSPVCAVLGGILAQDILKALAAKEPPIANLFVFDGNTGHGSVCRMNM